VPPLLTLKLPVKVFVPVALVTFSVVSIVVARSPAT
jgi:hypothetical protein